ncbi:MAG: diguanylate cyclase, partial [Clostridia bacterium]|nr:diguanylate cyclase [Clostridia bacterium]
NRIVESLPEGSLAARLSGDEFLLCFPYEKDNQLRNICKKILKSIKFTDNFGNTFTASMGVALYPIDAGTQSELMSLADKELEKVKAGKKGEYSIYCLN